MINSNKQIQFSLKKQINHKHIINITLKKLYNIKVRMIYKHLEIK